MGSMLLAGGEKGHRSATPNSRIMIHEASGSCANSQVRSVGEERKKGGRVGRVGGGR